MKSQKQHLHVSLRTAAVKCDKDWLFCVHFPVKVCVCVLNFTYKLRGVEGGMTGSNVNQELPYNKRMTSAQKASANGHKHDVFCTHQLEHKWGKRCRRMHILCSPSDSTNPLKSRFNHRFEIGFASLAMPVCVGTFGSGSA